MKMHQRSGTSTAPQIILFLFLGSCVCVWTRQLSDNYEKMKLLYQYPAGYYKRLPSYDFGLGKRSFEQDNSNSVEEQLSPMDALMDKEGLLYAQGKRSRAYAFGLGKRQERRSKIYSFGLGKRQSHDAIEDYDGNGPTAERRANPQRQFSFGLGKREATNIKE